MWSELAVVKSCKIFVLNVYLLSFKPVASVVTVDIIMLDIRWYFVLSYHRLDCLAWWHNRFDVGLATRMQLRNDSRQVVHTVVSLSPSSMI